MRALTYRLVASSLVVAGAVGLVAGPVASAVTTGTTTVQAQVGYTISMDSVTPGTTTLAIAPVAGGSETSASTAVTVTTNDSLGYTLTHSSGSATLVNGASTIPSTTGTWTTPIALANNTWGYGIASGTTGLTPGSNGFDASYAVITNQTSAAAKFAAMPTTPTAVRATSTTASSDVTTFWFAAKADNTIASGNYTATISYSVAGN